MKNPSLPPLSTCAPRILVAVSFFLLGIDPVMAQQKIPNPRLSHITLGRWAELSLSEATVEFGPESDKAESIWNSAVQFEWSRCIAAELGSEWAELGPLGDGACEFVICHSGGDGGSGNGRKAAVRRAIVTASADPSDGPEEDGELGGAEVGSDEADVVLTTAYNRNDAWCGFVRLNATIAERIWCAGEGDVKCSVTPLIFGMKLMWDTVDEIQRGVQEYSNWEMEEGGKKGVDGGDQSRERSQNSRRQFPTAEIYLCPGALSQNYIDELTNGTSTGNDGDSDVDSPQVLDVTQQITDWLLLRTTVFQPSTDADTVPAKSAVTNALFWTVPRLEGRNDHNLSATRQAFWMDVLSYTLETDVCDITFTERLLWEATVRSATDFSVLTVTFNDTATADDDIKCALALVAGLAVRSEVCAIEVPKQPVSYNGNAQWMIQSGGLTGQRPWFDHGLNGTGQVVAVSDTGVDINNCYFWDEEAKDPTEVPSDRHRKIVQYVAYANGDDYLYGHGTHVAGTVVGQRATDGKVESTGVADGVARGAKLAFFDVGDDYGKLWLAPSFMMLETGRTGDGDNPPRAHIHSASWGFPDDNHYTSWARNFDVYMENQDDFLVIAAAANLGKNDAANTVSSPATFKNGISVGASHSCCGDLTRDQFGPAYIAYFSSRGPTSDGRMVPHVVAPGRYMLSAGANPDRVGECDEAIPEAGGRNGGLLSIEGTSMATPVVSGTAAQIWQYFQEGWYPEGRKGSGPRVSPSGALVKAVLLNGAQTNMKGVDNGGGKVTPVYPYDNTIGFGRIDLQKSLYIEAWSDVQARVWDRQIILDGMTRQYNVTIDKSNGCAFDKLSATLVWMDREVTLGCTQCVVDDLDLHVTNYGSEGEVYYPNGRNGRDDTNNAERVVITDVQDADLFTLHVTAFNLDGPSQKFALVATGCFGGVANTLDTSQNVYDLDDSEEQRKMRIIIITCSSVGGFLVLCLCCEIFRRRRQGKEGASCRSCRRLHVAKDTANREEEVTSGQQPEEGTAEVKFEEEGGGGTKDADEKGQDLSQP